MYKIGLLLSTISAFLGRGLAIISGIILAKTLAPDLLGLFASDQSLVLLGGGLINLGIGQGYRMIVSRSPQLRDTYLLPTLFLRIVATVLHYIVLSFYLTKTDKVNIETMVVIIGTLLFSTMELLKIDLEISRHYKRVTVLTVGKGLVLLLSAVMCWLFGANYSMLVWSYLVFVLLLLAVSFCMVKPAMVTLLSFNYLRLIKKSIPFAAGILAYAFTSFWGLTYIREVLGPEQAGYYFLPFKVYQISLVIGMSVSGITLPLYHSLAANGDFSTFAKIFNRITIGVLFLVGPIVAVCFFVPDFLVKVFATEAYLSAVPIFPWIGFGIMFRLLAIPAGNILESVDKQWYRVLIQVISAVICALGVVFIVPSRGIIGAAWVLFVVDLWTLLAYWCVSKYFATKVVALHKLFVPSLLLAVLLYLSTYLEISVWYKLILFCFLWSGYVLFGLQFKNEITTFLATYQAKKG